MDSRRTWLLPMSAVDPCSADEGLAVIFPPDDSLALSSSWKLAPRQPLFPSLDLVPLMSIMSLDLPRDLVLWILENRRKVESAKADELHRAKLEDKLTVPDQLSPRPQPYRSAGSPRIRRLSLRCTMGRICLISRLRVGGYSEVLR